ncbi:MAG: hypothetical protein RIC55_27075 [Pirellulaceae bacterium]
MLRSCWFSVLVLTFVCSGAFSRSAEQADGAPPSFPEGFLEKLPRKACDSESVTRRFVENLEKVEETAQRVRLLNMFAEFLPTGAQFDNRFRDAVETTIEQCADKDVPLLASIVAHFPSLHEKLLARAATPKSRNVVRSNLARRVADFEIAQKLYAAIDSPEARRIAIVDRIRRTEDLAQQLTLLEEAVSLFTEKDNAANYDGVYSLSRHAADAPQILCDLVERHVPADPSMRIYRTFADRALPENRAAARQYLDAAWARLPQTSQPHEHASLLLSAEAGLLERDAWLAKYDEFIMPALRDARTHIGPLSELARFDIELMIDRTRKSCVHPARRFEDIMPSVMTRAVRTHSESVLTWLEENDASWKDRCIFQLAQYESLWRASREPSRSRTIERIGELALQIKDRRLRLLATAHLAANLRQQGVAPPHAVVREGRALLGQREDFERIDLHDFDNWQLFWLGPPRQQQRRLELEIERLDSLRQEEARSAASMLCFHIRQSNLAAAERLTLYRQLADVAQKVGSLHLQSEVASYAAEHDASWAIGFIWRILPEDRGRSGKAKYFDYQPPPYDAVDAVNWLRSQMHASGEYAPLMIALWEFLPTAPPQDRDGIRLAICRSLVQRRQYEHAMGLAEAIADPVLRVEALIGLFAGLHAAQRSAEQ